jgi:hypothetical protein
VSRTQLTVERCFWLIKLSTFVEPPGFILITIFIKPDLAMWGTKRDAKRRIFSLCKRGSVDSRFTKHRRCAAPCFSYIYMRAAVSRLMNYSSHHHHLTLIACTLAKIRQESLYTTSQYLMIP